MFKIILLALSLMFIKPAFASETTGKITEVTFYGAGVNEVIFVTIDSNVSVCPYKGQFVMFTKDRPAMTSGLLAAFQAQNTVTVYGTGACHTAWTNHEVVNYAKFKK